ncbi:DNA pilot protein [Sigmofec virus UA08Rod_4774]|uniref:DNA pilot protein n=1 Tax=Sigmofec virus UA08Rod_4774 TaxID=2929409 RepID=A0A976N2E6_9VIRU|nr:DNA pilot protein [Sigmofec virus UA08Rod_4774]
MGVGEDIAVQAAGQAVNGFFGWLGQKRQQRYTQRNMQMAHQQNEESADKADSRKRAFYTDYESPAAMYKQLKDAGLSPGLFYGGSGAAGSGASGGAQAAGSSAPIGAGLPNPGLGLDLSQIKLNEAQARKLNADADYLEGKNPGGEADIAVKLADAGLKNAQKSYTKAQEDYTETLTVAQKFTNDMQDEARQDLLDEYKWRVNAMVANYEKAMSEATANKETLDLLKEKLGKDIEEIQTRIVLNTTNAEVSKEDINKLRAETYSINIQAKNEKKRYEWLEKELKTRLEQTGMMKQAMIISGAIGAGANVVRGLMDVFNPVKGLSNLLKKTGSGSGGGYWGMTTTETPGN